MPWNLLLLPLLGGFLFLRQSTYHRIRSQRFEGNRLALEASLWGIVFLAVGRFLAWFLTFLLPDRLVNYSQRTLLPFDFIGTAILAFLSGPAAAWIWNYSEDDGRAKRRALEDMGQDLLAFCQDALEKQYSIALSMENRKVYVGRVLSCPNMEPESAFVVLLPFLSGYRDDKTLQLAFTTDYLKMGDTTNDPSRFRVLLPVSGIASANRFDPELYAQKFIAAAGATQGTTQ